MRCSYETRNAAFVAACNFAAGAIKPADTLQVWVGTSNADTKAFRVSVRYSWQAQTYSDSRTVDRSWLPFSGAVFVIPDVGIKVLSITVEELKTSCSVEFAGEP